MVAPLDTLFYSYICLLWGFLLWNFKNGIRDISLTQVRGEGLIATIVSTDETQTRGSCPNILQSGADEEQMRSRLLNVSAY